MSLISDADLIYIYNKETLQGKESLISEYLKIYEEGFPDANERENFDFILKRVSDTPLNSEPHTFIILSVDRNQNELYGGIIGDWYKDSEAIHLTYIVVKSDARGKNTGKSLIIDGVTEIRKIIEEKYKVSLGNVFFESNNPEETNAANDSIVPLTRLKIFASLGAKWIDIPYVQPSLDNTKSKVKNLFLFTFPDLNYDGEDLKVRDILNFLSGFYKGLGIDNPENNEDYAAMATALNKEKSEVFQLKNVPVEMNTFQFRKVSIAMHFIENYNTEPVIDNLRDSEEIGAPPICNYFNSYEKDLLSFRNQRESPFYTSLQTNSDKKEITILFPDKYEYITEGRVEKRKSERKSLRARFSISNTNFHRAKIKIWHLVLSPVRDEYFSETDLIKLINSFGSRQECSDIMQQCRVSYGDEYFPGFSDFLKKVAVTDKVPESAGTGIVQIDTSEIVKSYGSIGFEWSDFYSLLIRINSDGHIFQDTQETEKDIRMVMFLKVLCGLILGIFDLERMGISEIEDTLNAIKASSSYFSVLSRGNLLCLGEKEEMLKSVYYNIGINPYLLIPSAVLTYNYYHLAITHREIDAHLTMKENVTRSEKEESKALLQKIPVVVNSLQLKDIFQYPAEKEIISIGTNHRGIDLLEHNLRLKLSDLKSRIEVWDRSSAARSLAVNTVIIAFIPVVSLYPIVKEILISWFKYPELNAVTLAAILSLATATAIAVITYIITIHQKKHEN